MRRPVLVGRALRVRAAGPAAVADPRAGTGVRCARCGRAWSSAVGVAADVAAEPLMVAAPGRHRDRCLARPHGARHLSGRLVLSGLLGPRCTPGGLAGHPDRLGAPAGARGRPDRARDGDARRVRRPPARAADGAVAGPRAVRLRRAGPLARPARPARPQPGPRARGHRGGGVGGGDRDQPVPVACGRCWGSRVWWRRPSAPGCWWRSVPSRPERPAGGCPTRRGTPCTC